MNVDLFTYHVETMHERLAELYEGANAFVQPPPELLPVAFMELGTASEELMVAVEELRQQNEELAAAREKLEAERQRYQDLFYFAPNGYLVTDTQGTIQEANQAAARLLNVSPHYLVGKPLILFVPKDDRQWFRSKLNLLHQQNKVQEWKMRLVPRSGDPFDAALTLAAVQTQEGNPATWRWLVRDITQPNQVEKGLDRNIYDLSHNRPTHVYCKGEIIPLEPQALWLVCKGLVKLTTFAENAGQVLVGLAGSSMPFGSNLTELPIYQATAWSKQVELVSISLTEIAASPSLAKILLPKISGRLRQTESLLAVSGQRRVQERLHHLLLLLKKEIGQPVAQGQRLSVRLTHEDLANACCTTRVTITRALGKLQQQGKITFDSKQHIILTE